MDRWLVSGSRPARNPGQTRSKWFALETTKEDFPWVYERDNTPSRIISTLEALAVLIRLKIKYGEEPAPHRSRITVSPTITDNRGNGAALNKLMTSKFPSSVILVELSSYTPRREQASRRLGKWVIRWFQHQVSDSSGCAFPQVGDTPGSNEMGERGRRNVPEDQDGKWPAPKKYQAS